jgi:hypothetical protein
MGSRLPLSEFPQLRSCQTALAKYRHFRLVYDDFTLCRRMLTTLDEPPEYRTICPECASTVRYLGRHKPEGRVDTLACLAR